MREKCCNCQKLPRPLVQQVSTSRKVATIGFTIKRGRRRMSLSIVARYTLKQGIGLILIPVQVRFQNQRRGLYEPSEPNELDPAHPR